MTTGLEVFDHTVQQTNTWLNKIEQDLGENRRRAYLALRGTLHALRDELIPDEAVHLAAQLPMLVRGFYYEGWVPSRTPVEDRDREDFLQRVEWSFERAGGVDPERAVRAVFRVLSEEIDPAEVEHVRGVLPKSVRTLWPTPPEMKAHASRAESDALG
jgi:uncharacterized protein (DUF2267 family)